MLFASLVMMLLAKARNDVMFANYAVRRNIIHAVNITAVGNIICPQGQTSFSVNAPLRASRYNGWAEFYLQTYHKIAQTRLPLLLATLASRAGCATKCARSGPHFSSGRRELAHGSKMKKSSPQANTRVTPPGLWFLIFFISFCYISF